jgi:hypothetical protein
MKRFILFAVFALVSGIALAGSPVQGDKTENGNGPLQDHTCQGGHNCNTGGGSGGGSHSEADATAIAEAIANSASQSSSSASVSSFNQNVNSNSATGGTAYGGDAHAYGGAGGEGGNASAAGFGGEGGSASQQQGQSQNQYVEDSGNSTNYNSQSNSGNNSSQSTSLNFESTGEARYANKYGNNVSAYAPAIYSSSACTAGGLSGAVSGFGAGVSLGGAKQDPQCQVRENARILASLDANLALIYLCANPTVDVGKVLGSACKPSDPPVIIHPPLPEPEPKKPEVPVINSKVKG